MGGLEVCQNRLCAMRVAACKEVRTGIRQTAYILRAGRCGGLMFYDILGAIAIFYVTDIR